MTPAKERVVEETQDRAILRAIRPFAATKPEEIFGSLSHYGKRLSDEDIEKALAAAMLARER